MEPKKVPKKAACDVKAKLIKLEGGTAAPVAGESLNRPDESKLSSVRFLLSPLVWLRQPLRPAALSAATGAWLGALAIRIYLQLAGRRSPIRNKKGL